MNYMLTNAGIELNAKIQSGAGAVLKITRAAGASGYSNNAGELSDLLNVKQTIQIEQIVREGITVTFGLILSNVGIEEEYILMQIGIYAEDPDTGKEILYIIGQDARGERVPAISEAQVEYKFNISQKISNTSSVVFETSPSDFLTKKVFTDFVDTVFSTHVNNKSNPHELTIEQLGAAAVDHKHDTAQLEGILPLNKGGTGAANASDARNQLGAAAAGHKHVTGDITGGTLPVDRGGTGGATPTAARTNLGLGTAATQGTANNLTTTAAGYVLDARQGKVLQDEIGQISSDLGGLKFGVDASGNYGYYKAGADSVTPFRGQPLIFTVSPADIKSELPDIYKNLTADDFLIGCGGIRVYSAGNVSCDATKVNTLSYDSQEGILYFSEARYNSNSGAYEYTRGYGINVFAVYLGTIAGISQ